jgi:hypothetical protein
LQNAGRLTACAEVTQNPKLSARIADDRGGVAMRGRTSRQIERAETDILAYDPITRERKGAHHLPLVSRCRAAKALPATIFFKEDMLNLSRIQAASA